MIKAIIKVLTRVECGHKLFMTATTGVATTQIDESTIDSLYKLKRPIGDNEDGIDDDDELTFPFDTIDNIWETLILEEISMLGCNKLEKFSKALMNNKSYCF